jgi:putative ABC transport system permease protein
MVDWRQLVLGRLAELRLTTAAESELTEEIAQHLEELYRELESGGATPEAAYARTVAELDNISELRSGLERNQHMPRHEAVPTGDAVASTWMNDLQRDLRYAGRAMRTNPVFVLVVVLTLGLGIGANTTVFTVINTLLLNPMPVARPSELVAVASVPSVGSAENTLLPLSYPNFKDYEAQTDAFESLAGYTRMRALSWQSGGATQALMGEFVTGNYFATLGVEIAAGRTFGPKADVQDGAHAVAVMNYGTWKTRFGGASDVIGRQLRLNGAVVTVMGVARPGFIGLNGLVGPDVWLPFALSGQLQPTEMRTAVNDRSKPILQAVGRLRPGVTMAQAQANLTTVASAVAREYPAADQAQTVTVRPIGDVLFGGGSRVVRFAGAVLVIVAGIVLLIACSNVANLMLARSAAREGEMAVRMALGASRARLVRQLLTESLCYGVLSGGFGVLLAFSGIQLLAKTLPATGAFVASRLDTTVLLFTLFISLATGVLFGALPALTAASRAGVAGVLKDARSAGRSARRASIANALLVGQVALSFLLLVTAALFLRSIQRAYEIDPGFDAARLAVFITNPGQAGYGDPQALAFYQRLRERVARLPGVESVSWASNMPLFARPVSGLQIEGHPQRSPTDSVTAIVNTVDDGYFQTIGISILKGRQFTERDRAASLPVVVVNEKLARDYWPGEDALGKRIRVPGEQQMREIVGVARTANYSSWGERPQPCVYVPLEQNHLPAMTLYVRSQGKPSLIIGPVSQEIRAADSQVLVTGIRTGQQITDGSLFQARIGVLLLGVFGLLALGLASVGLYGILTYAVTQRQREIGLRMALGASRSTVMQLILKQGMTLVSIGVAIGFLAALLVSRVLSGMLYGVGATDPVSLLAAASALGVVALLACYVPARWATRVDPLVALRHV